jgi:hypothetical protein
LKYPKKYLVEEVRFNVLEGKSKKVKYISVKNLSTFHVNTTPIKGQSSLSGQISNALEVF